MKSSVVRFHQVIIDIIFEFKRKLRILKYIIFKISPNFPIIIQIQTNNRCNGYCSMCPLKYNKQEKISFMPEIIFQKIIKEVANEKGFRYIVLQLQNEPLLDPDVFKKIQEIKKIGNNHILTYLTTNGSLFTNSKILELEKSGLDELVISLDSSSRETYNKIRPGFDYEQLLKNIQIIKNSKYNGKIFVGFVRQNLNKNEYNEYKKLCKKLKVRKKVSYICNRTGDLENFNSYNINKKETSFLRMIELLILQKVFRVCPFTINWINILYNGDVIICCNDYNKKITLGNINQSTIKEIWNNKKFEEIRKLQLGRRYEDIISCKNCSLFKNFN